MITIGCEHSASACDYCHRQNIRAAKARAVELATRWGETYSVWVDDGRRGVTVRGTLDVGDLDHAEKVYSVDRRGWVV